MPDLSNVPCPLPEQNTIVYSAVGDGSALAFFSINSQTGGIFVKNSLRQDSLVSYTVSCPYTALCRRTPFC